MKINGEWIFIMTAEDINELKESFRELESHYTSKIAEISRNRMEDSKESAKSVANLAINIAEQDMKKVGETPESKKAIKSAKRVINGI